MSNKMLIDATHPEETRVVVVRGQRIEEFDFEAADRKPLRGNIYLAKVTRVEPSLQAAFIEYGGNRHGFLAFSEIHPDYYQIPVADREALIAEDRRAEQDEEEAERPAPSGNGRRRRRSGGRNAAKSGPRDESVSAEASTGEGGDQETRENEAADAADEHDAAESQHEDAGTGDQAVEDNGNDAGDDHEDDHAGEAEAEAPAQLGGGAEDEVPRRPRTSRRNYKIQEVIKRRQILLVQVVKEERGTKGAALTTYLSLAGRYSVLMPNTGKGGGISRKITSGEDRKRLKEIVQELDVPEGMGIILRTAGASRTKPEIKRDYEYLMRTWDTVRELTLTSSAPALVYEEGSLVRRAIRDLYNKDIDDVQVAGETAYRDAKEFMKLLMPSHAKMVKPWREATPLFARYGVESQLDAMFSSVVTLKSGGYIVINQTEALVAIDINSGRSTREHNIEDTALKTNLEAAEEISRQLRLRDLAGLVVIDFIDMEENRNNRAVEKRLHDCLKNDRARIQLGRISAFGLLEMSRQRIRTGVLESSSVPCATCNGTGLVRAAPSVALQILRALEENLIRSNTNHRIARTRTPIALYVLNNKRRHIAELEGRFGVNITVAVDDTLIGQNYYAIDKGEIVSPETRALLTAGRIEGAASRMIAEEIEDDEIDLAEEEADDSSSEREAGENDSRSNGEDANGEERGDGARRKRRRRRRRGGRGEERGGDERGGEDRNANSTQDQSSEGEDTEDDGEDDGSNEGQQRNTRNEAGDGGRDGARRRRGRRGGRRNRGERGERDFVPRDGEAEGVVSSDAGMDAPSAEPAVEAVMADAPEAEAPKPKRGRKPKAAVEEAVSEAAAAEEQAEAKAPAKSKAKAAAKTGDKPVRGKAKAKAADAKTADAEEPVSAKAAEAVAEMPEPAAPAAPPPEPVHMVLTEADPSKPKRGGWWRR
ncbi:MAG: Rne/Rng family ribonuclease [Bosea sp. (in: a-proteobacteria)]